MFGVFGFLKLVKAVVLLREIVERCPDLEGNNFVVMVPYATSAYFGWLRGGDKGSS